MTGSLAMETDEPMDGEGGRMWREAEEMWGEAEEEEEEADKA